MSQWKKYFLCVAVACLGIGSQVQAAQTPSFWGRLGQAFTRFKLRWNAQDSLYSAIPQGDVQKARTAVMFGARVNPRGSEWTLWKTPLAAAAATQNPEMVKFLINAGAKVNVSALTGTPLENAIRWGAGKRRNEVVQMLLDAGADPRKQDTVNSRTPLMDTIIKEAGKVDPELIKILLKKNVTQLFQRDKQGATLLHYAAEVPTAATLQILYDAIRNLEESASENIRAPQYRWELSKLTSDADKLGKSPYHMIDPDKDPDAIKKVNLLQELGVRGLYTRDYFGLLPEVLPLVDPTRK